MWDIGVWVKVMWMKARARRSEKWTMASVFATLRET